MCAHRCGLMPSLEVNRATVKDILISEATPLSGSEKSVAFYRWRVNIALMMPPTPGSRVVIARHDSLGFDLREPFASIMHPTIEPFHV